MSETQLRRREKTAAAAWRQMWATREDEKARLACADALEWEDRWCWSATRAPEALDNALLCGYNLQEQHQEDQP